MLKGSWVSHGIFLWLKIIGHKTNTEKNYLFLCVNPLSVGMRKVTKLFILGEFSSADGPVNQFVAHYH